MAISAMATSATLAKATSATATLATATAAAAKAVATATAKAMAKAMALSASTATAVMAIVAITETAMATAAIAAGIRASPGSRRTGQRRRWTFSSRDGRRRACPTWRRRWSWTPLRQTPGLSTGSTPSSAST
jgi:hypothetical protein